ncbi:serine hydrolase domain-containing protein [Pseudoduganella sp. GCM10020061]|uniref:serine hydrolase domain-containing protein n=1 Tax=Pseudoduganella sp. GCM10020061 TaxID=3317345 RepID=UPI00362BAE23
MLDEVIVKPLGLQNTRFENGVDAGSVNRSDVIPGRVSVYSHEGGQQRLFWFIYPPATYAAGGLFTSVADLARLMQAIDRGELVSEAGRQAMWTPATLKNGQPGGFGIGWTTQTVRGKPAVGHSGGPALGDVIHVPGEHLSVIVLTNQRSLYPAMAQAIAARFLPVPAFMHEHGAKDKDPALSARLFELVQALGRGDATPQQFAGAELDEINSWTSRRVAYLPAPVGMTLLSDRAADGRRTRVYRVRYGAMDSLRWTFTIDQAGRVTETSLAEE